MILKEDQSWRTYNTWFQGLLYYTEEKKPGTKEYILHDSVYIKL